MSKAEPLSPGEVIRRSRRVARWSRDRYVLMDDFLVYHRTMGKDHGDLMRSFAEWVELVSADDDDSLTKADKAFLLGLVTITEDGQRRVEFKRRGPSFTMVPEPLRRGVIDANTEGRIADGDLCRAEKEPLGDYLDRLCAGLGYEVKPPRPPKRRVFPPDPSLAFTAAAAAREALNRDPPRLPYKDDDDLADLEPRSETRPAQDDPEEPEPEVNDPGFI